MPKHSRICFAALVVMALFAAGAPAVGCSDPYSACQPPYLISSGGGGGRVCAGEEVLFDACARDIDCDGEDMTPVYDGLIFSWYVDGQLEHTDTFGPDGGDFTWSWFTTSFGAGQHIVEVHINDTGHYADDPEEVVHTFTATTVDAQFCEVTILEPLGGTVAGTTPIRFQVRIAPCGDFLEHLLVKEMEDTALHNSGWVTIAEVPPGFIQLVDSSVDPVTGIKTFVYELDWNTTSVHNGPHKLWAEGEWQSLNPGSDEITVDVKNLVVSASPEYLLYNPDDGTGNTIHYTLADANTCEEAQQTTVHIELFSSDQTLLRTDEVVKTASAGGAGYDYVWDGKDDGGNLLPKGVYLYRITGTQECVCPSGRPHSDSDCEKSSWYIASTTLETVGFSDATSNPTVRFGFMLCAGPWCDHCSRPASDAKLQVFDCDLAELVNKPWQSGTGVPLCQDNHFSDFEVPVEKDGPYRFLLSVRDGNEANDRAHRKRPLLQCNQRKVYTVPVSMFYGGSQTDSGGLSKAWTAMKGRYVHMNRLGFECQYKIEAGARPKSRSWHDFTNFNTSGPWARVSNPEKGASGQQALASLAWGGRDIIDGACPDVVWMIFGHGFGGTRASKAVSIGGGSAIAASRSAVSGLTGYDFAYVDDLPDMGLLYNGVELAVLAACESMSNDINLGSADTLSGHLYAKGVRNIVGVWRVANMSMVNKWIGEFGRELFKKPSGAVNMNQSSIRIAAVEAQRRVTFSRGNFASDKNAGPFLAMRSLSGVGKLDY